MQDKQLCKIQGMVEVSKVHAAWYLDSWYKYYVKGVKRNKIIINKYFSLHLRLLFVMSEVPKALYTYMNRMKPLPQYVHTDTAVASSLSNLQ